MKNLFLAFVVVFCLSSFNSDNPNKALLHSCTYNMSNASGAYLGQWTLYDVPDGVSCGSQKAKQVAIDSYNGMH